MKYILLLSTSAFAFSGLGNLKKVIDPAQISQLNFQEELQRLVSQIRTETGYPLSGNQIGALATDLAGAFKGAINPSQNDPNCFFGQQDLKTMNWTDDITCTERCNNNQRMCSQRNQLALDQEFERCECIAKDLLGQVDVPIVYELDWPKGCIRESKDETVYYYNAGGKKDAVGCDVKPSLEFENLVNVNKLCVCRDDRQYPNEN
eukprot:GHVP01005471.1.p1 GENE.GHVP01005471.1~~GHVP01005471.1.p1  ORF type:complete len:205 (+),score=37.78 GHVP01005471.1:199-813(+)